MPSVAGGPAEVASSNADSASRSAEVNSKLRIILPIGVILLGGAIAFATARVVYPHGSADGDELAYLSQADALLHGHLTLSAASHDPWFMPWLSSRHGTRVVFKYQPVWPALLAFSKALTGSFLPAVAAVGAGLAASTYGLALAVTRTYRSAAVATLIACLSPFFMAQTGTYLPYALSAALVCAACAVGIKAERARSVPWYVVAGGLWGLAFFHRGFDAILVAIPFAAWLVFRLRRNPGWLRAFSGLTAGFAPFLAMYFAYNRLVTGSLLKPAFSASSKFDTFGFGTRASYVPDNLPISGQHQFTPGGSWNATLHSIAILPIWVAGSLLTLAVAVFGVVVCRRRSEIWILAGIVLVLFVGYFFWWGPWNAVNFGLYSTLGPFYLFSLLPPVAIMAALGVDAVVGAVRLRPTTGYVLTGVVLAVATVPSGLAVRTRFHKVRALRTAETAPLRVPLPGRTLLLTDPAVAGEPYVRAVVPDQLSGRSLVALLPDHRPRTRELLARFPDRRAFIVVWRTPQTGAVCAISRRTATVTHSCTQF